MYESKNLNIALSQMVDENIAKEADKGGFYRAIVVQNTDPFNLARIQIRVPAFHGLNQNRADYVPDNQLPYAYPASLSGASHLSGQYIIPLVGSLVWVSFEVGTSNFIYFGGIYCADGTGSRSIYFDRSTNNGEMVPIEGDDIPSNYNPNRYVLFRSPKGSEISIDDRDNKENIQIVSASGDTITMNRNGVNINTKKYLKAKFPYLATYYIHNKYVQNLPIFEVDAIKIFNDIELSNNASLLIGSRVVYIDDGICTGSGVILDIYDNKVQIGSNGCTINGSGSGVSGTDNYNNLRNRPSINEVILEGNINLPDTPITNLQLEDILK